jgi:hypothetical protein
MLFNIRKITITLCALAALVIFCAAWIPQWVVSQGTTTSIGLRQSCSVVGGVGGQCHALSVATAAAQSKCCQGDTQKMSSRLRTTEAFVWIGAVSMLFAAAVGVVGMSGTLRVISWAATMHGLNLLALVSFVISAAVGFTMFDMSGPRSACASGSCTYYGAASVALLIALFTSFLVTLFGLGAHVARGARAGLLSVVIAGALVSGAFAIAAALSPSWFTVASSPDAIISIGTLQGCAGTHCKSIDFSSMNQACHGKDISGQLHARFRATTAMMVISAVFAVGAVIVTGATKMRGVRVLLLVVAFIAVVAGLAVMGDTFDRWYLCGENFFGANQSYSWGISFGFAVLGAILIALVLVVHVADAMWASAVNTKLTNDPISVSAPRGSSVTVTVKA